MFNLTVDLHCAGSSDISSVTGELARVTDVTFGDMKKSFPSHGVNADLSAGLQLHSVLR